VKVPVKRFWNRNWIGWLNILLFQWLFIRLNYIQQVGSCKMKSIGIQYWVVPTTGWGNIPVFIQHKKGWWVWVNFC
jgi:hypothetical protein